MRTGLTLVRESDGVKFYGEIAATDIMKLQLDSLDQHLLETTENAAAADQLLVIEMLFRRMQEQTK